MPSISVWIGLEYRVRGRVRGGVRVRPPVNVSVAVMIHAVHQLQHLESITGKGALDLKKVQTMATFRIRARVRVRVS